MALIAGIAGPYTSVYNSSDLGIMEDGYQIRLRPEKQLVNETDIYGDTIIDAVYRGGNCTLEMMAKEFSKAFTKSAPWPFGDINSGSTPALGFLGTVGMMDVGSSLFKAVVLTAIAGTTAAATPASMTATQAILAENAETNYTMTSKLRMVPLTFRLYPYQATNPSGMPSGTYELWFLNA